MTTAGDIINQALKDVGVIGSGEAASGEDVVDALDALNQIIGQWLVLPTFLPKPPYLLALITNPGDELNLPPVYDSALRYSLGERLLTVFSRPNRPDILAYAAQARKVVKRSNLVIPDSVMPDPVLYGRRYGVYCDDVK